MFLRVEELLRPSDARYKPFFQRSKNRYFAAEKMRQEKKNFRKNIAERTTRS